MKKNTYSVLVIVIIIIIYVFYWLQIRPSNIRKFCHQRIIDMPGDFEVALYKSDKAAYDNLYEVCLHEKGLK